MNLGIKPRIEKLLRKSEKYTKTDMVYVASGGLWLSLEKVALIFTGLAASIAFANLMEPEKYGVYKYVLAIVAIAGTFTLSGLNTALGRSVARGFEKTLHQAIKTAFFWSGSIIFILLAFSGYYLFKENFILGTSFIIAGAFMPAMVTLSLYANYLTAKKLFKVKAILNVIATIIPSTLIICTLFFTNNPALIALFYFGGTSIGLALAFIFTLKKHPPEGGLEKNFIRDSSHLSLMNVIGTIANNIDRILIFSQLGGTQLALYSFARLAPEQLRSLNGIIASLALPKLANQNILELKKNLPRKAFLLFLIGLCMSGAYILFAPLLFETLFPAYMSAVPLSRVLALTIPIALPSILFSQSLVTHMRKKELYILKTVTPLIRILLIVLLLPLFQIWGIVAGILISYILGSILLLILFFRSK